MMKCIAAAAFTIAVAISLTGCGSYEEGTTLSISLTGQPSPIGLTTSSTFTDAPSVYYSGKSLNLMLTYNVLQAPSGGVVTMSVRASVILVTAGALTAIPTSIWSFDRPGTYVVQGLVQEIGENNNGLSATDTATFIVTGPATD